MKLTDKEMASELRELIYYLGFDGSYRKTLQKIAERLDPQPKPVPVTEAHIGCPVVRRFSGGSVILARDTDPQAFIHPERYKIAITHRHDGSAECPVSGNAFMVLEYTDGRLMGTDRPAKLLWRHVVGYSIIDVVPLQEAE